MSFICQDCNEAQPTGSQPKRTVTKIRTVGTDEYDRHEEIAQEKNLCSPCAEPYEQAAAERYREKYKNVTMGSMAAHRDV